MEFIKETTDRRGGRLVIRSLTAEDAKETIWVMHACMGETLNLARYPDEMRMTIQQEIEFIEKAQFNPDAVLLGAFADGEMAGMCSALPVAANERYAHRAGMGIMILKKHWGRGIGTALMAAQREAMMHTRVEQIELDVVSTNAAALALYERAGFVRYGLLERGMKYRDGSYADLVLMKLDLAPRG